MHSFHLRTESIAVAQLSTKLHDNVARRIAGGRRREDNTYENMMIRDDDDNDDNDDDDDSMTMTMTMTMTTMTMMMTMMMMIR